jgi:hypothetical protein
LAEAAVVAEEVVEVVEALEEEQGSEPRRHRRRFHRHHKLQPSPLQRSNKQCPTFSSIYLPTVGAPTIIPDARINILRKFFT